MVAAQKKIKDDTSYIDELAPGTELLHGQYKIDKFLNSGGFGITYLAKDGLDRRVVIKECFPSAFCHRSRAIVMPRSKAYTKELKSVVELFIQEARSLAKLKHPNIVGVHQVFEDNSTAYMVLDFVEGRDLLDTLEDPNHGLTAPQIKGILKDVLSAVGYIHSQDILHRDISPDNILLDADMRPFLIDFGAAREEATKKSRVLSALRVVKDGYSPQEFYIQGSEQSPSSDLYALGASFYHLITGEVPPNSQARLASIASGDKDTYVPLVNRVKGYDNRFLAALDKSLAILPKDRLQSAEDWLDALERTRAPSRVVTMPISSAAAATLAVEKQEKRFKAAPLLGSVAVIAVIAAIGWGTGLINLSGTPTAALEPDVATPVETATDTASAEAQAQAAELAAAQAAAQAAQDQAEALAADATAGDDVAAALAAAQQAALDAQAALTSEAAPVEDASTSQIAEAQAAAEQAAAAAAAIAEQQDAQIAEAQAAAEAEAARIAEAQAEAEALAEAEAQAAAEAQAEAEAKVAAEVAAAKVAASIIEAQAAEVAQIAEAQAAVEAELAQIAEAQTAVDAEVETEVVAALPNFEAIPSGPVGVEPAIPDTTSLNGVTFVTRYDGTQWGTFVAEMDSTTSEFQVGDQLVADVNTSEPLNSRTALKDILERGQAGGVEMYYFAVSRGGSMWILPMEYSGGA